MVRRIYRCGVVATVLFATMPLALGTTPDEDTRAGATSTPSDSKDVQSRPEAEQKDRPVYTPPRRGAPITRVGGGTRSASSGRIELALLSPPHTGLTTKPSPTLYWYVSDTFDGVIEFVVTDPDAVAPLLKYRVEGPVTAGIHPFDLDTHAVALEPNQVYQWSVALVRDPERRSHDVVSIATIERIERDDSVRADDVSALAGAGLWYDAMEALQRTMRDDRPTAPMRSARADLLDQAELPAVAAWDRAAACATASC